MNLVGVDLSTRAVHYCWLDFDSDQARVRSYEALDGDTLTRARTLNDVLPARRSSAWDDVALVAIERPMGPGTRQVGDMMIVVGIVIAHLPPQIPVWLLGPTEWRSVQPARQYRRSRKSLCADAWPDRAPGRGIPSFCVAWAARALSEGTGGRVTTRRSP
jgi:hypothetical protein